MKLFNYLFLALMCVILASSCMKEQEAFDPLAQFEIEKPIIKDYVQKNYPNAILNQETGIWYDIEEPGQAGSFEHKILDTLGSQYLYAKTRVNYSGKLLNGNVFDSHQSDTGRFFIVAQNLKRDEDRSLIPAWIFSFFPSKIGNVETFGFTANGLQIGSKIRIVTPSLWGYGNQTRGTIPANSPLDFTIEVIDLK